MDIIETIGRHARLKTWAQRYPEAWAELREAFADVRKALAFLRKRRVTVTTTVVRVKPERVDFDAPDANGESEEDFEARRASERAPAREVPVPPRTGKASRAREQRERARKEGGQ